MGPAGLHHMQLELDATRYILTTTPPLQGRGPPSLIIDKN